LIVLSFRKRADCWLSKAAQWHRPRIPICLHGQNVTGMTDCAQHQVGLTMPNCRIARSCTVTGRGYRDCSRLDPEKRQAWHFQRASGLGFELNWDAVERCAERYQKNPITNIPEQCNACSTTNYMENENDKFCQNYPLPSSRANWTTSRT
jgi:hypothetical protein